MSRLITSAHSLVTAIAFDGGEGGKAPAEIVYLPEGSHKITPLSQKDGVTVHVPAEKGEAIAAALNADLQKRMGDQVKPWTDFEHTRKFPASGYPTAFRYEKGKGIMAAMDWSKSGREAVEGRDVRYFSPEFYVDDNGVPSGIPMRGPLGGLVTEPAFREIGPIAASDAGEQEPNTNPTMSKLIFAALAISAAAENAETEAVSLIEKMKQENQALKASVADKDKEIAALMGEKTRIEAAAADARKERADTLVQAAVADGRILPKDEDKQNKFREKISAGDSFAEEILAQLPKLNGGLDKQVVTAASGKPVTASGFEAKAQSLVTAGAAPDIDTALGIVASEDPEAYNEYLKSLG
jgi:phage I-like protein